jgi:DNA-binding response OmpR family regulator
MTTASHFSLLVVDDEPDLRTLYELTLLREGYDLDTAGTVQEALLHLKDRTYSAVITDMRLPDGSGLDVLHWLEENGRREKTGRHHRLRLLENAVDALKAGAYDYLTKPVDLKQFRGVVASALGRGGGGPTVDPASLPSEQHRAMPPTRCAARRPRRRRAPAAPVSQALGRMAGNSTAMQQVRSLVQKVARSMAPVLVAGESGTGKELVARAIHEVSARGAMPFVPVNCSAIPEQLLEAEFFGYRKGAFTGANDDRDGFFQAANGGTLFLDEIGDLPLSMQSKLLRAIQERSVRPVGRGHRAAGRRAAAERDAQGPRRRGPGRPVPPGSLLPPQRHPDPRAAAARAARGPDGHQRAGPRAAGARRRRLAGAAPDPRRPRSLWRAIRSRATCASSRTCCIARSPSRRRGARRLRPRTCRSRCSPTAPRRSSTACPPRRASPSRGPRAQPAGRGAACPRTWPAISTRSSATS